MVEGVRTEPADAGARQFLRCVDGHETEGSGIDHAQLQIPVGAHHDVGVGAFGFARAGQLNTPRHAQMGDPREILLQVGQEELSPPADAEYPASHSSGGQVGRVGVAAGQPGMPHVE